MVDALISNVIQQLATIVQNEIQQEVRLVVGVKKDIEKLSRTFTRIQAVLKDAEKRQIMDDSIKLLLQDLKDVSYDIDDVLDEWRTEILKSQIERAVDHDAHNSPAYKKVCPTNLFPPCFCFKQIGLRHDIGHKIKEIKERLDEIATEKDKFGFIETTRNEIIDEPKKKQETSSFVDVSEVFGRDQDRDVIISKLLSEGSQQVVVSGIPVISIVGMGGMGKTTLAQLATNDNRVKNHFNKIIWVHVSKSFDKVKITMNIVKEIGGNIVSQGDNITWQDMHRQLTSSVDGKHFLLILDDVWNEDSLEWDPLRLSLKYGSKGSRIIVTTRNERVAKMMGTTYVCRLRTLSDEACWSLLSQYAFVGRQQEECEKLEEIGMKLAKKCDGLPLSAKTLGSLLQFKKSKHDWQYVLESDLWKIVSSVDQPILPALLLSYNDLPSHLKQCFAYCSLKPRDSLLTKFELIREWSAQGFHIDNLVEKSEDFLTISNENLDKLVMRSFLQQQSTNKLRGRRQLYQMHDLVHDFAKFLAEKESFTLTIKGTNVADEEFSLSKGARHLYLQIEEINMIPSFLYKENRLRTLKIHGHISKVSSNLFYQLTFLRTLNLGQTYLEELPKEIEELIHLRYLDLSKTRIKELPKTVTSLYNLQMLHLYGCKNLCKLPEGIGALVNLVELDVTECRRLRYLPEGIGRLSKLRYLSDFIIGGVESGAGCKIGELKDLNFLKGSLKIVRMERVENGNEAKMACLKNKQHLRALYFYYNQYTGVSLVDEFAIDEEGENREEGENKEEEVASSCVHENIANEEEEEVVDEEGRTEREEEEEEEEVDGGDMLLSKRMEDVLESLQPHPHLEKLSISDYPGAVFPNWVMSSDPDLMVFSNLVFLELKRCRKCKQLPPTLGKLPSLETLVIAEMDKVKFMGVEFFGIDGTTASSSSDGGVDTLLFPKLKIFMLGNMQNLKEWYVRVQKKEEEEDGKDEFIFMPRLQHLVLMNLPKLRSFPRHLTQVISLRKLFIWSCPKLNWMPSSSPSSHLPILHVEELILKKDAGSFSRSLLVPNNHMFLPHLKLLRLRQSPFSSLPKGLGQLTSLQILDIRTCSKIKSIPEEVDLQHLPSLQELRIMRCPALTQRCQKEIGEDWSKISPIPNIFIDGQKIK